MANVCPEFLVCILSLAEAAPYDHIKSRVKALANALVAHMQRVLGKE